MFGCLRSSDIPLSLPTLSLVRQESSLAQEGGESRYFVKPWCVIRHLPSLQRLTVARFTRRNDADAYHQALRRLIPTAKHAVIFDVPVTPTKE